MNNPEIQATLSTLEKTKWTNKNGQSRDTGNIGHVRENQMDNPETQATLGTRNRTKTNKAKN